MNFRRLGGAVLVLGLCVLLIGVWLYVTGAGSRINVRRSGENMMSVYARHTRLMERRSSSKPVMSFGLLGTVAGAVLMFAAGPRRAAVSPPAPPSQASGQWYYLDEQDERIGPVLWPDLVLMAGQGTISPDTKVWADGMPSWTEARSVQGLFSGPPPLPQESGKGISVGFMPVLGIALLIIACWVAVMASSHMALDKPALFNGGSLAMVVVGLAGACLLFFLRRDQGKSWILSLLGYVLIFPFLPPVSALMLLSNARHLKQEGRSLRIALPSG